MTALHEQATAAYPHWLRDVDVHLPITAQFVVHGNIRDWHLIPAGEYFKFRPTLDAIWSMLALSGYQALLTYDSVAGLGVQPANADLDALEQGLAVKFKADIGRPFSPQRLSELVRAIQSRTPSVRVAIAIDYASQFVPTGQPPTPELHQLFLTSIHNVHTTSKSQDPSRPNLYNPTFWLVDRPSDLPGWMVNAEDGVHAVPIPTPNLDTRTAAAKQIAANAPATGLGPMDDSQVDALATFSDGMTLRAMNEIVELAVDQGMSADKVPDAIRMYRVGLLEDPWRQESLKVKIAEAQKTLPKQVLGQPAAIRRALDILIRSTTGLSGAHTGGRSTGPRGVLFFAGPTGVGKTELAKRLTEVVFGDLNAYIRFDMSEFAHESSDQRLIGSPPGYVGHESGGELTNAIRQRPFSLVLFDEIEKAHPRIMDKFLQILSDGRLTDGSGATVHFSESLIVFTSNKGMADPLAADSTRLPSSNLSLSELDAHVRAAINRHFTETLQRPEILNRIGDNIVVFDYLRPPIDAELFRQFITSTINRVHELHGIEVTVTEQAMKRLQDICCADPSMGGRGIGQLVEAVFTNPLARKVFAHTDGSINVQDVARSTDGTWDLVTT